MADFVFRGFLQAAYISSGKNWQTTLVTLEAVMTGNYTVVRDAGGSLISTSVNGKTFAFQVGQGMTPDAILGIAQRTWAFISRYLADDATGASIIAYLTGRPMTTTQGDFSGMQP